MLLALRSYFWWVAGTATSVQASATSFASGMVVGGEAVLTGGASWQLTPPLSTRHWSAPKTVPLPMPAAEPAPTAKLLVFGSSSTIQLAGESFAIGLVAFQGATASASTSQHVSAIGRLGMVGSAATAQRHPKTEGRGEMIDVEMETLAAILLAA